MRHLYYQKFDKNPYFADNLQISCDFLGGFEEKA